MNALTEFLTPGITFLLTVFFGLWLSKLGRPYNGMLFNIHKLIALGTVIIISLDVYKALKAIEFQSLIIFLVVAAVLCVLALFATGAFMSMGKLNYGAMKTIHILAPIVVVVVMALMMYLLVGNPL